MTVAVSGPRCWAHPDAECPGGSCVECCRDVGNPVSACGDCGTTSCPGRCGMPPLGEPECERCHDRGCYVCARRRSELLKTGPVHRGDLGYGGIADGASTTLAGDPGTGSTQNKSASDASTRPVDGTLAPSSPAMSFSGPVRQGEPDATGRNQPGSLKTLGATA